MDRRTLLASAGAATVGSLAHAADPSPAQAARPGRDQPAQLSGKRLLDAFIRMRGDTSGKVTFGWLDAMRYTVIDGEIAPFCQIIAGEFAKYRELPDERYEATLLEVTHYCDPATGEPLKTVTLPVTGRTVEVPRYRFGPSPARFAVSLDETEDFSPEGAGSTASSFAPKGRYRIQRDIVDPRLNGGDLLVRSNEYGRTYLNGSSAPSIFYREWIIWQAPATAALDPKRTSVPSRNSYSALSGWRPWMQMGDVKGHTAENGRGGHVERIEDLPDHFARLTKRIYPDVLDDPEAALRGKPR